MSNNPGAPNPIYSILISLFSLEVGIAGLYDRNPSLGVPFIILFLISAAFAGFQAIARRDPTLATMIFIAVAIVTFFLGTSYSAAVSESQRSNTSKPPTTEMPVPNVSDTAKNQLSQDDANKLVREWLDARSSIFAPPFNQEKLKQLTTDALYKDANNQMARLKNERNSIRFRSYRTYLGSYSCAKRLSIKRMKQRLTFALA